MKVSHQRVQLRLGEATGEGRHHIAAGEDRALHLLVGCRRPAGQRCLFENPVQVRRRLLQLQIVIAVAVCAVHLIQVLPFRLLGGQRRAGVATGCGRQQNGAACGERKRILDGK